MYTSQSYWRDGQGRFVGHWQRHAIILLQVAGSVQALAPACQPGGSTHISASSRNCRTERGTADATLAVLRAYDDLELLVPRWVGNFKSTNYYLQQASAFCSKQLHIQMHVSVATTWSQNILSPRRKVWLLIIPSTQLYIFHAYSSRPVTRAALFLHFCP